MEEEKELTETQKKSKGILARLKGFFKPDKKIWRIRVVAGTQSFWVKNPKKIQYWKNLAEKQALFGLNSDKGAVPAIQVTKVEYQ